MGVNAPKSAAEWAVSDSLMDVDNETAKWLKRIKEHTHYQVKLEHAQAALEGRPAREYDKDNVRELLRVAAITLLGGMVKGELE